jgi:hypothetical protein
LTWFDERKKKRAGGGKGGFIFSFFFFCFFFLSFLFLPYPGVEGGIFFMPFSFLRARKNILLFLKKSQGWIDRTAGKIKKGMGGWTLGPSIFYLYRQHAICFLYFLKKNDCKSSRWVSEKVK